MKKNFHSILMLISLIVLCTVLHHTLDGGTKSQEDQAANEGLVTPPAARTFPAVFFMGLE